MSRRNKKKKYNQQQDSNREMEIPPSNGFYFNGTYVPKELIVLILSFLDNKSLIVNCPLVCKDWYFLMREVWKLKAERINAKELAALNTTKRLPWIVYKSMILKNGYNKNLLKNCSGQDEFEHWDILDNGGNGWLVEKPPIGVIQPTDTYLNLPTSSFVTSYTLGRKQQIVNLLQVGIDALLLDRYIPDIIVSEWYAARWDCNSKYDLNVKLLNLRQECVDSFTFSAKLSNWHSGWKEVTHTFNNYKPGVRFVVFEHSGKDSQFWAGHYGSKMCNASVIVSLKGLKQRARETLG